MKRFKWNEKGLLTKLIFIKVNILQKVYITTSYKKVFFYVFFKPK